MVSAIRKIYTSKVLASHNSLTTSEVRKTEDFLLCVIASSKTEAISPAAIAITLIPSNFWGKENFPLKKDRLRKQSLTDRCDRIRTCGLVLTKQPR